MNIAKRILTTPSLLLEIIEDALIKRGEDMDCKDGPLGTDSVYNGIKYTANELLAMGAGWLAHPLGGERIRPCTDYSWGTGPMSLYP